MSAPLNISLPHFLIAFKQQTQILLHFDIRFVIAIDFFLSKNGRK